MLARVLGPANLGLLGLANSAAVTLSGMAAFGLGDATGKVLAEYFRRDQRKGAALASFLIWFSFVISSFFFIGLWLAHKFWAALIFPNSVPNSIIGIGLLLGWINVSCSLLNNALSGLQLFRDATIYTFIQALVTILLAVTLGIFWGVPGAIIGYVLASMTFSVCVLLRLRSYCAALLSQPLWPAREDWRTIVAIASPMWAWALLSGPLTTLCFAFLAHQPKGPHELGIFNTANALKLTIALLPALLGNVINPAIIEEGGQRGKPEELAKLLKRSYTAMSFLVLPALLLMTFASDVLFLIYGDKYASAARCFIPLAASAGMLIFSTPAQFAMVAKNKAWWNFIAGAFQQLLLYALARIWIGSFLALGLAWAFFVSQALFVIFHLEIAVQVKAIPSSFRRPTYGFLLAVICSVAAAWFLPNMWKWCLAIPLSLVCAIMLIRRNPELANWISSSIPPVGRPWWMRFANFVSASI